MCTAHACGMFDIRHVPRDMHVQALLVARQTELEQQQKVKAALEASVKTEHKQQVLIRDEGGRQSTTCAAERARVHAVVHAM
jgi:hypothetical protein